MPETEQHPTGSFCWNELATSDIDAALVFYSTLFGWEVMEADLGDQGRYIRCTLKGRQVAAVCDLSEEQRRFAAPPVWHAYVAADDVESLLERAVALGGQRFEGPIAVPEAGTLGTVADPDGALLCLWQPTGFTGSGWTREIGAPVWNELQTRQVDATTAFYAGLFGWTSTKRDLGDQAYTSFTRDGQGVAGIAQMGAAMDDLPPHWMVYFAVARCEDTVEAAQALDATVRIPPTDIPQIGRFAVLGDPQGGTFAIIQLLDLSQ